MDDVGLMLFRQRLGIQELYQVQYRFDGLQPQFKNELCAFHNRRRRWTTQARFRHLAQASEQAHQLHAFHEYPDPSTPSTPHSQKAPTITPAQTQTNNASTIQNAINILNLNIADQPPQLPQNPTIIQPPLEPQTVLQTPANSLATIESNHEN